MGMLGSVVLLILGALASANVLSKLRPGLRFWFDLLTPFSGLLGVGATIYGLYLVIRMVAYLGFIRYEPVVYLAGLFAGLVSVALGVIYGFDTARGWLTGHLSERQLSLAESLKDRLQPYKTELGYAGLALGTFGLLINFFK